MESHKEKDSGNNYTPAAILLGSVLISISILLGMGVIKIKGYSPSANLGGQAKAEVPTASTTAPLPTEAPSGPVKVAFADSPMLGNKNAQVAIVEFSDYECPFCKRYFDETYSQIKKDYIDTGKVKLVYRNLPLSFHQNAQKEAEAALCSRDQGGDETYFKYHDEIFTRTKSNGLGLALDQLPVIAQELGLNVSNFKSCLDSGKYTKKVEDDITAATSFGATGTPSFFIGKTSGDAIEGTLLVGAQPYTAFKTMIDKSLE